MFHVHSSGISNMKNIKGNIYLAKGSVSSKHRVEPESKKWHSQLTQYSTKCNAFILKCFLQFICTNLDGSQKGQRRGAPTLEKTMSVGFMKSEKGQFFKLQNQSENFFWKPLLVAILALQT